MANIVHISGKPIADANQIAFSAAMRKAQVNGEPTPCTIDAEGNLAIIGSVWIDAEQLKQVNTGRE